MTPLAELKKALRDGLTDATPGPWESPDIDGYISVQRAGRVLADVRFLRFDVPLSVGAAEVCANARHIARCSPDNIRLLLDHIEELEKALADLRARMVAEDAEGSNGYTAWIAIADAALQSIQPVEPTDAAR